MSLVTLVSGGLDSTMMAILAKEDGVEQHPLFVDYGQRARKEEWRACQSVFRRHRLPAVTNMDLSGFGRAVPSGLTNRKLDVLAQAFLPGRNLLLLLAGAAYAAGVKASGVAIGLLDERQRIFDDQSKDFLGRAEALLRTATASAVSVTAPLIGLTKVDVLRLARERGLEGTYSCHKGTKHPCGRCLSCKERLAAEGEQNGR